MRRENHNNRKAWCISIVLHLQLFFLVAASGFFLTKEPVKEQEIVEVTLYSGGNHGDAPKSMAAASAPEVVLSTEVHLPEIGEEYTKHPERQKEYKEIHHSEAGENSHVAEGLGTGKGNAEGNGKEKIGTGNGTGKSNGNGEGKEGNTEIRQTAPSSPPERVAAVCIHRGAAVYPEEMRAQGAEGTVRVRFYVSADGSVESVEVIASSGFAALDRAALQAAYQYRFSGGTNPGVFTDSFTFQLTGEEDW